jgi:hypothetical protein
MSEYQAMRVAQAIRAETDRISDYRATGHRLRKDSPSFHVLVQPVHDTTQSEGIHLSLDELQRVRWALSLTPAQHAALLRADSDQ